MAYIVMHNGGRWSQATGRRHKTQKAAEREIDKIIAHSGGGYKRALFKIIKVDMRAAENKEWFNRRWGK